MKYYVIINGNSSLDIQGLAIESLPNISKPLIRTTREEIDGRDGDIITKLGYSAYDKTLNIGLWGNYDINEVIAYFNEEGVITFSNEPDKYYKFSILNRIDFINQLEKFKKASITIHCQPFKYKEQEVKVIEEEEHTTSGTSFNLSDTLEASLLMDLKGNTSQTGTPTPSSPKPVNVVSGDNEIVVCGKNLFDKDNTNAIAGFIGSSVSTITQTGSGVKILYIPCEPNTIYTIKKVYSKRFAIATTRQVPVVGVNFYNFVGDISATNLTITTDSEAKYLIVEYYIGGSSSPDTLTEQQILDSIMIIVGQTVPTSYIPYTGTIYNIDLPVENKLNKDGGFTLQGMNAQGGLVSNNTNALFNGYIDVLPDTSYTLSTNTQVSTLTIAEYNGTTFVVRKQANNVSKNTITTSSTTNKVRIIISKDGSTTMTQEIIDSLSPQLELGSKANTYTPYGTTPIELCKIGTYQDYIYKENDKWYLHKEVGKIVLNGSEDWSGGNYSTNNSDYVYLYTYIIDDYIAKSYQNSTLNTYFARFGETLTVNSQITNDCYSVGSASTSSLRFMINKSNLSNLQDTTARINSFKNWLSTHNTSVYYVLATPTNTEITYTPLIEQLNTLEQAQSYEGTTNINQVNNDLPFIIDLTYYTGDTSITITNDGNICSKPLLELKGTGNINIYLNGIQVFVVSLNNEIIYIDTDKMEAYYQGTLKNRQVVGDYNNFKLQSGNNNIQVDGGYVEYLKITNYSRWV